MAVRKLYTVCAISYWRGKVSDVIVGMTVARSEEEVTEIVRRHVPPQKTFTLHMANTGGPTPPDVMGREAEVLGHYGFDWLDPRGPKYHPVGLISETVVKLVSEGQAL